MDEIKRAEIKQFAIDNNITDAKVLEHYYVFGTLNMNSTEQEVGKPRSEHYNVDDLQSIIKEIEDEQNPIE